MNPELHKTIYLVGLLVSKVAGSLA
jgi:hypothetical protein